MKINGLRYPKTASEIRANKALKTDPEMLNIPIKARQRFLPTSYDDIPRRGQKSWKKQRKKQYIS